MAQTGAILLNRDRRKLDDVKRLLIRSTNWIGDAVMTTPAVRAIRRHFPEASISLLAKPWVAPVFAHSPHVDEIIVYEANGRHRGAMGPIRLARDLRSRDFDAAILPKTGASRLPRMPSPCHGSIW